AESDNEWLWLLTHDSAPEPRALQQLLAAVEIAPSVAIAGPKLMRWEQPDVIAEFGESMTKFGASMPLVEGELDQAQHDVSDDVLGVAAHGMFVRRSLWSTLNGFDPELQSVDAGLDFSIRARLAGFRVVLVPGARVATAGGPEHFGRRTVSASRHARLARSAQLHRRLTYAPLAALPLHWLSLLPLAVLRSLWDLLAKRPGTVPGEFSSAFAAAFGGGKVARARGNLRRTRVLGWRTIAPLRLGWAEVRERRAQAREAQMAGSAVAIGEPPVSYLSGGGLGVTAFAIVLGLVAFGPLLGAQVVSGGGLSLLDPNISALWGKVGFGWREIGTGFLGASDPFLYVLAGLGSLTFWAPSFSIVLVFFAALPLAAMGAWFAARRISTTPWIPTVAAVLWAVAPPLLSSLTTGHLGASLAHMLLPWFVLALLNAARSLPASAASALLMAVIAASAPILAPVLLASWVLWMVARPRSVLRLVGIPIPALALFTPLVIDQLRRGNPLGLLADPGVPSASTPVTGWQLAFGSADGGLNGWVTFLRAIGLDGALAPYIVVVLLVPLIVLALLSLFLPGTRRAVPALSVALAGFTLAVVSSLVSVTSIGAHTVTIWPGSGLSVFWLGLVAAAVVSLQSLRRASLASAGLLTVTAFVVAVPLLAASFMGVSDVAPGATRIVPAVVEAESGSRPDIGTLTIIAQATNEQDTVAAVLQRGLGTTLDDQSSLSATARELSGTDQRLAMLAGNLASRSGLDPTDDLQELFIGFVVLADVDPNSADLEVATAVHDRVAEALDGNERMTAVGQSANGLLWRVAAQPTEVFQTGPSNTGTPIGIAVLASQALIFFLTLLLAVPTSRRERRVRTSAGSFDEPATTFDEDPHV
ncbi:MAG: glycosyltransferase family 2 protein, partial [Homoserinimonas sp.]|nr:glycosyltransferase family 2 protein [Homoserinimonas sp.]